MKPESTELVRDSKVMQTNHVSNADFYRQLAAKFIYFLAVDDILSTYKYNLLWHVEFEIRMPIL